MPHSVKNHFGGKSIPAHLKEARVKGAKASAETHGTEISGQKAAFADSLKDTALAAALLWLSLTSFLPQKKSIFILLLFLLGWTIWKTGRSACFGWARLERLHRIIEEERWEIEHHRTQEREELLEIYQAKGFEGALLTQVVDVLMADDNILLQIMLEEELGLSLEAYEHPLEQASGAFLGALAICIITPVLYFISPTCALFIGLFAAFLAGGIYTAKIENIKILPSFVWNGALFSLSLGITYFAAQFCNFLINK